MALVHFNTWSNADSLQHYLNRLLDDVVTPLSVEDWDIPSFVPGIELYDNADAIVLNIELPGMQPDDIDIEVTAETVSIKGTRQPEHQSEDKKAMRSEFRYGSFSRLIKLPSRVKNVDVIADYRDGILHLTLPKTDAEKNRVVKVSVA
ncbi:MAG: Hsp20/alpha crystallin family protein [Cyanobacteria bacterium J06627_8]